MQLNDLFTDTKKELEETTADLVDKRHKLEVTTTDLHVTKERLGTVTQQRDEQTHLVVAHVKTEGSLSGEAKQVLKADYTLCLSG